MLLVSSKTHTARISLTYQMINKLKSTIMKTLAILLLTVFTTISSFASIVEPLATTVEDKTITVYFDHEKLEKISISILDKFGRVLLSEKIQSKNRKSRSYNLEQLPYGVYTIKIDSDQKIVTKKIKTGRNNTLVINEKINYKPTSMFKDDKWMVNVLALGEQVDIKIFDEDYSEVYNEKVKNENVVAKAYDLSNLDYGVYTLSLTVDNKNYNKVIAKM